jgi:hypothetical protein
MVYFPTHTRVKYNDYYNTLQCFTQYEETKISPRQHEMNREHEIKLKLLLISTCE